MPKPFQLLFVVISVALAFFLNSTSAQAHAGDGIVADADGNIFYTDLNHVWQRSPDGTLSIAVPDVHTHQLYMDGQGNLFGEHLWYEGDASGLWRHYVWRREPSGSIERLIQGEGLLTGYGFVRDASGRMYWPEGNSIYSRIGSSEVEKIATLDEGEISSLAVADDGRLYAASNGKLFVQEMNGRFRLLAAELADGGSGLPRVSDLHEILGLNATGAGVYVAAFGDRAIKHVDLNGSVETIVETRLPWSPSGMTLDAEGRLWILEYSLWNDARVRLADESQPIDWWLLAAAVMLFMLIALIFRRIRKIRRSN